jgi:hypothetical protein
MSLNGNTFGPGASRYEDCRLVGVAGIVLAGYVAFFFVLYWLMQPTVTANSGLAAKTIVKYADAPWVPPNPSPIRTVEEPAPVTAKRTVTETKKQEARTAPRQARRVRQQPNPWGYASSPSFGSRPWF